MNDVTSFGSSWLPLSEAVKVLKVRVHAPGRKTCGSPDTLCAAAVVAVETWLVALRVDSLSDTEGQPSYARTALDESLRLVHGPAEEQEIFTAPACTERLLAHADQMCQRVTAWGLDPGEVLPIAAAALSHGAEDEQLARAALSLVAAA